MEQALAEAQRHQEELVLLLLLLHQHLLDKRLLLGRPKGV